MVSRRQSSISEQTPVRFYKIVALSFLALTVALLGIVVFLSSKRATIIITTKAEPVQSTQEIEAGGSDRTDIGAAVTSTVVTITRTFEPESGREEPGPATGTVTLRNETNTNQILVATTRLLSPSGILFRLKNRVVVPAGGTTTASVYADKIGEGQNLPPTRFTIPGLNEAKQTLIYAESASPMSAGVKRVAVLSRDDVERAEKELRAAIEAQGKEILLRRFGQRAAGDVEKGAFLVTQFGADTNAKIGEEVSQFSMAGTGTVTGVLYSEEKMKTLSVQSFLKKAVRDSEIVEPSKESPVVAVRAYDPVRRVATLTVVQSGRAILDPESADIQKSVFFGKTKDEVRRYLLSLRHVDGVEVHFRPAWMRTVPHVPDHVQVIVKNIE